MFALTHCFSAYSKATCGEKGEGKRLGPSAFFEDISPMIRGLSQGPALQHPIVSPTASQTRHQIYNAGTLRGPSDPKYSTI